MDANTDTPNAHQRVWFVTGSSRGLGRALITAILDAGDLVA
ncbi:short-chain dehydrogenase, partial [Streptomyces nigra]